MTYQRRQPPNLLKQQLKLSSLIIPEYYAAHTAIWSGEYNEYLGDGGRGSLKSTFAATEVVLLIMRVPNIHAVVLRKVGNTLATSVWPEYNRVIDRMGIRHLWKQTKKPYTLTYVPTGQTIQFYGLDDPGKLKSIAVPFGYFGVIQADFNEEGLATGEYTPKLSYRALQHLCTLFDGKSKPEQLPIRRVVNPSSRVFDKDASDSRLVTLGFRRGNGTALAYWEAADLMRETFDSTVSFQLAGVKDAPRLVDLMTGDVYQVPETLVKRDDLGEIVELVNLPLTDSPLLLMFGDFDD